MAKLPLISLSIVSHTDAHKVSRLLETLQIHEQPKRFQLILTNNVASDLIEIDTTLWADVTIIRNQRPLGFAQNHNRAFALAQGDFFCVINPDVTFRESVFDALTSALYAQAADIIAPSAVDSRRKIQDTFRSLPTPASLVFRQIRDHKPEQATPNQQGLIYPDWIAGTFLLMRARVYQILGGFDERYWLYFEDVDLCTRARLLGLKPALDPRISIHHDAQRTSHIKLKYLFWHLQSALRFFSSKTYKVAKRGNGGKII